MSKKARIKDIAKLAGVSIGTVDRVLHDRGEVAEITAKKVLKIANDLDYSPNLMARALRSKQSKHIVVLLPEGNDENAFWIKHHQGLEKVMAELEPFNSQIDLVTYEMQSEDDFKSKTEEVILNHPDGVVFAPVLKNESLHFCDEMHKLQIPYIFIDSVVDGADAISYIGEDAYQSGRIAAHLIDYGTDVNRDVLIINVAKDLDNRLHLSNRTQGFLSYFMDSGMNKGMKISLEIQSYDKVEIKDKLGRRFAHNKNIGAVFVTSSMAHKIGQYFEEENLRDINLIGYDIIDKNVKYLRTGFIKFLLSQRPAEQTEIAVRKLFDYIHSNKVPNQKEHLPIDVITPENLAYFI